MAVKVASRLNYKVEEVFNMPLAKLLFLNSTLNVIDGNKKPNVVMTKMDKEIATYLSNNQDKLIKEIKSLRR